MIQRVWCVATKINPSHRRLEPTRERAEAAMGTYRHLYSDPEEVELDVVFAIVKDGWLEDGGGQVERLFHSYERALSELKDVDDSIEVIEVES